MKQLLRRLFNEFGFYSEETESEQLFFQKQEQGRIEYYLVLFITKSVLADYGPESLTDIHKLFDIKKEGISDIEKNTSLIICVLFDNYASDCQRYKNIMLQIEEDEYWFKKYLLPYTTQAVANFDLEIGITQQLNLVVNNDDNFKQFNEHIHSNESYFFAIQCFLKLPFLNLVIGNDEQFVSIRQMLATKISTDELSFLDNVLINYQVQRLQWEQLLSGVANPHSDVFDEFLQTFSKDASAS